MNTIKIPFRGITRNTDDGVCQDGDCMELINAHVVNGSIEPVSKPIELASFQNTFKSIHYHANAKKYICVSENGSLEWKSEDFSTGGIIEGVKSAISVSFIGNTMTVVTTEGLRYFLHKDDAYYNLGGIPELPLISIKCESKVFISDEIIADTSTGNTAEDVKRIAYQRVYGEFLKLQNRANKEGYFLNGTVIRMAYRLFDGSHIKHSPLLFVPRNAEKIKQKVSLLGTEYTLDPLVDFFAFKGEGNLSSPDTARYTFKCAVIAIKPEFYGFFLLPELWKDLILGIDVFSSFGISCPLNISDPLFAAVNPDYIKPSFSDQLQNISSFYKIASINTNRVLQYPKINVSKDSLALQETLSDDTGTNNIICPQSSYDYNSRMHIWNLQTILYPWYHTFYLSIEDSTLGNYVDVNVYTYLSTEEGDKILKKSGIMYGNVIHGIVMYPDYRAKKIVIHINNERYKEFKLTRHPRLNAAVYYNFDENDILRPIDTTQWTTGNPNITPTSQIEKNNNGILKVSELNNPFFFPPRNTYHFQTEILSVQSNTVALSQGQFGQHPLYVFCRHGIYALSVGTGGDVVYTASSPVSRDVATSPYTTGIDSAVAFLSDRGALLISGTQVQNFSEPLDGFLPSCVLSSPIIPKVMAVAGMEDMFSSVVFRDYCNGAKVGYNYQQSEVIIANAKYPYAYAYSIKSTSWHKISLKIHFFINAYPNTYVFASKGDAYAIYDLNNNHRSIATMALISRPIKLGTNTHKRILQSALRGIVKRAMSDLYLRGEPVMFRSKELSIFSDVGFYILGSNDAEHFMLVSGKESITDIRDLVTKMTKSKAYKYFMVCLVGGVRSDVSINYIELIADESYNNRLR